MFELKIINSGYIMVDGGAMFGAIPKRAWMRKYSSTNDNLCRLVMRCVLAVSAERRILIDLGMGNKHLKELAYYQPEMLIDISDALASYGYSNNDITDVVLTHLHFDHCGYATYLNENGIVVPSFPKAKYWLSHDQWKVFNEPNRLEKYAFFSDNIVPIYNNGLLHLVNNVMSLCDGFEVHLYDGHTLGQLVPYIKTKESIVAFPGDLVPTASHVPLEWISAFDNSAITSIQEKERFLKQALAEDLTLIYCHDEKIVRSKVKLLNDNYRATELSKD